VAVAIMSASSPAAAYVTGNARSGVVYLLLCIVLYVSIVEQLYNQKTHHHIHTI